ncbi:MAG: hypothetical protein ABW321_14175, partial [Polyangiales bacterium]
MIVCPRCSKENQDHYKFCLGCGSELPREVAAPRALSPQTPPSSALASAQAAVEEAIQSVSPAAAGPEKGLPFARTQQGDEPSSRSAPEPVPAPAAAAAPVVAFGGGGNGASALSAAAVSVPPVSFGSSAREPASYAGPNSCPACGNPVPVDFKFCGTCGHRMPAAAQAPAPQPQATSIGAAAKPTRGSLIVINPDGTEGGVFPLAEGSSSVGRNHSALFAADAYLSPTHATFTLHGATCNVVDEN